MLNLADFKGFQEHAYARHLLLKTDNLEMLVVCWMPGQSTVTHGHGNSDGVVIVLDGEIHNTSYCPEGKKVTAVCKKGDVAHTPIGYRHQMANHSADKAVTLHVYTPPLAPEFLNPDLGYANEVTVQEVQLPDEVIRYVMASPSRLMELSDYSI